MASGTIASLRDRGYGFITPDGRVGRGNLFFDHTAVAETSFSALREGQRVSFDQELDPREPSRRRAINVRLVDSPVKR